MLKTTEKWRFACYGIMWAVIAVSVMVGLSTEKMLSDWTLAMAKYTITVLFLAGKSLRIIELRREKESVMFDVISAIFICGVFWSTGI